jgi:hypothetical protein
VVARGGANHLGSGGLRRNARRYEPVGQSRTDPAARRRLRPRPSGRAERGRLDVAHGRRRGDPGHADDLVRRNDPPGFFERRDRSANHFADDVHTFLQRSAVVLRARCVVLRCLVVLRLRRLVGALHAGDSDAALRLSARRQDRTVHVRRTRCGGHRPDRRCAVGSLDQQRQHDHTRRHSRCLTADAARTVDRYRQLRLVAVYQPAWSDRLSRNRRRNRNRRDEAGRRAPLGWRHRLPNRRRF